MTYITTFAYKHVNPLRLQPEDIDIRDIAHALALINRFVGHTPKPISVAQHSVYVSRLCEGPHALQALLHDASEAYLGDVSKWVKQTPAMCLYREIEDQAQRVIFKKYGCKTRMHPSVVEADKLMVRFEAHRMFGLKTRLFENPEYPKPTHVEEQRVGPWKPWIWTWAEESFLERFRALTETDA
jgi:uncharacterized protein